MWSDTTILQGWWRSVATELRRIVKPDGHVLMFCDGTSYAVFYPVMFERWANLGSVVWDKGRVGMGSPWRHQHELIIAACDSNAYKPEGAQADVIRVTPTASADREHPVEKPRELLAALIRATCPRGGVVLDPFAGSGTTLEAAAMEGREAIGIEMSDEYCAIIRRRMANIQAVLL
jgi:site-specific DNA-methyltransferase (adenine-specific)